MENKMPEKILAENENINKTEFKIKRYFTQEGTHPYDAIEWKTFDAVIKDYKTGEIKFEQKNVEFPASYSQRAVDIIASKYFRGQINTEDRSWKHVDIFEFEPSKAREWNYKQLIDRVVWRNTTWGLEQGYFTDKDEAKVFSEELIFLLLNQYFYFNSPVWFNMGYPGRVQTSSACFILPIEDSMEGILDLVKTEGMIFKAGSGSGVNVSKLRSKYESLSVGGTSSGVLSFMKLFDVAAGVIKSAGAVRRAASMKILNIDHPEIIDFIQCKTKEEEKAYALIREGYESSFNGEAYSTVAFQNANHSVRVNDEFMQAVESDGDFWTKFVTNGKKHKKYNARVVLKEIAKSTWKCGDPGLQYHDTVNKWNTVRDTEEITGSNPCVTGETLVAVADDREYVSIKELSEKGEDVQVYSYNLESKKIEIKTGRNPRKTGENKKILKINFTNSRFIRATENHNFMLDNGEYVEAKNLKEKDSLMYFKLTSYSLPTFYYVSSIEEDGYEDVYNITVGDNHNLAYILSVDKEGAYYELSGIITKNCSEFSFVEKTSCNLASHNLMKYIDLEKETFNTENFIQANIIGTTAMDIWIDKADYPNSGIDEGTKKYRTIGVGYANLGSVLMALGISYDSEKANSIAAAITSLLTASAYSRSGLYANKLGSFPVFAQNKNSLSHVLNMHREENKKIKKNNFTREIIKEAEKHWTDAIEYCEKNGHRNSFTSCLAPTGTIGLAMDCDTTGCEPELALVKYKKLAGSDVSLQMVNTTVNIALRKLGYSEEDIKEIENYILARNTVKDCPVIKQEHISVFDTAFKPGNSDSDNGRFISPQGHLKMLSAIQPFVSGSISKTVNTPETTTVDEIMEMYLQSWKMGIKCVAIYRDNSKGDQPLTTIKNERTRATRVKLPDDVDSKKHKFTINGYDVVLHTGCYEDGSLGEIYIRMGKTGSTMQGIMDTFAINVSMMLQYGIPLKKIVEKMIHTKFEPFGFTSNKQIPMASSIVDYIVRYLSLNYLSKEDCKSLGINGVDKKEDIKEKIEIIEKEEKTQTITKKKGKKGAEKVCPNCGGMMEPQGTCFYCPNCFFSSGCGG